MIHKKEKENSTRFLALSLLNVIYITCEHTHTHTHTRAHARTHASTDRHTPPRTRYDNIALVAQKHGGSCRPPFFPSSTLSGRADWSVPFREQ